MTATRLHHTVDAAPDLPPDAPVVVLGPSIGARLGMWDPQVPVLAAEFRVVRYDTRGHAPSPVPPGPYDVDDLADDVVALLDELEVERAHLVGLSLGGMTAAAVAARYPERVARLALLFTTAAFDDPAPWLARIETVRERGTGAIAEAVVGRWFTPGFADAHPDLVERCRGWLRDVSDEGYAACCHALATLDLRDRLPEIEAPTLVVSARDDAAIPPVHQERLAASIAGAHLVHVPGAHLANLESVDAVTGALLHHLRG
ncbi:3-oxoadipate enol-lactonase [Kineococcus sp. SYSU DK001]|uniref:3-oxoadipate enol-lactonase n=1 Tax=Kineococcus sp. SYSU DK001 TaxID=3383122 RepID=UPI003D7DB8E3